MQNNIVFSSATDGWSENLAVNNRNMYAHLAVAFKLQWLLSAIPKASIGEHIQALKE